MATFTLNINGVATPVTAPSSTTPLLWALLQVSNECRQRTGAVAQVHAQIGGHLVIAATSGAQLAADLGSNGLEQSTLQGRMHVLVIQRRRENTAGSISRKLVQARQHGGQLVVIEQASAMQHPGVGAALGDVIRR